jgi:hypothetical protein
MHYNRKMRQHLASKPANTKRLENQRSKTKLFARSDVFMKVISGQNRNSTHLPFSSKLILK